MRRELRFVVGFSCCCCAAMASCGRVCKRSLFLSPRAALAGWFFRLVRGSHPCPRSLASQNRLQRALLDGSLELKGAGRLRDRSRPSSKRALGQLNGVHSAFYRVRISTLDRCALSRRKSCENSRPRRSGRPQTGQLLWAGARRRPARPYQGFARCQTVAAGR